MRSPRTQITSSVTSRLGIVNRLRWIVSLLVFSLVSVAVAQDEKPAKSDPVKGTPIPEEGKNRVVEIPKVSEADQVKLPTDLYECFHRVDDEAPLKNEIENEFEHQAYCLTLIYAHRIPLDVLARQSLKEVPFANLVRDHIRRSYRNELIHVEGKLVRIRPLIKPPQMVKGDIKVKEIYEGWLFPKDDPNFSPITIVFTELPPELKIGDNLNYWVTFDGYYFKLMEYESQLKRASGSNIRKLAPLLLGHSPQIAPAPESTSWLSFPETFVPIVILVIGVILMTTFGLTMWFRRGDRQVRSQITHIQSSTNPFENPSSTVETGTDWNRLN
jgi:hypothetical protein